MFYLSIFQGRMPNNALQRTPLARPLTWARLLGAVACQRSCRSVEVASGAAESWASGRPQPVKPLPERLCYTIYHKSRCKNSRPGMLQGKVGYAAYQRLFWHRDLDVLQRSSAAAFPCQATKRRSFSSVRATSTRARSRGVRFG